MDLGNSLAAVVLLVYYIISCYILLFVDMNEEKK